ncbi:helix-hairpin-helix domain-containing protein [Paenibacillus alkaliterrae]|uniref:ComEA family DNA-binding protein n=1 Tax=Paenibacillus alkaliterrae TaxID=320909 RepID=UPI001F2A72D0|nr:helix-hairpin-helix domain-containing protein [Paenibacillus alkaliterrae]MCF2940833.1 helix-hairpin-helix domain-containing protein [Paenibacillus alkaliterrae]
MKQPSYGLSNKMLLTAAISIAAAFLLLAAALLEPKRPSAEEWVPLNRAVETALEALAEPDESEPETEASGGSAQAGETGEKVQEAASEIKTEAAAEGSEPVSAAAMEEQDSRLDINRATAAEFDTLKGIGPAKAEAIIADRELNGKFASPEDLLRVKGIGEKLLSGIRESIVVRP